MRLGETPQVAAADYRNEDPTARPIRRPTTLHFLGRMIGGRMIGGIDSTELENKIHENAGCIFKKLLLYHLRQDSDSLQSFCPQKNIRPLCKNLDLSRRIAIGQAAGSTLLWNDLIDPLVVCARPKAVRRMQRGGGRWLVPGQWSSTHTRSQHHQRQLDQRRRRPRPQIPKVGRRHRSPQGTGLRAKCWSKTLAHEGHTCFSYSHGV